MLRAGFLQSSNRFKGTISYLLSQNLELSLKAPVTLACLLRDQTVMLDHFRTLIWESLTYSSHVASLRLLWVKSCLAKKVS